MFRPPAFVLLAALVLSTSIQSADSPPAPKSTIKFPEPPPAPPKTDPKVDPAPSPTPKATKLGAGVYYIIHDDAPFLVYASPPDLVTITKTTGPATFLGIFADGTGKFEEKKYSSKNITTIRAAGTGKVELIVSPVGATDESSAIRKILDVDSGKGPQPPPKPPTPKPPTPKPPKPDVDPPQPVTSFRVIFVHESGKTLPLGLQPVMDAKSVRDYLEANTTKDGNSKGWRRYDQDANVANENATMKALWEAVKPKLTEVPCLVIEVNGKATILPYPKSAAESLALLKKYHGDK